MISSLTYFTIISLIWTFCTVAVAYQTSRIKDYDNKVRIMSLFVGSLVFSFLAWAIVFIAQTNGKIIPIFPDKN